MNARLEPKILVFLALLAFLGGTEARAFDSLTWPESLRLARENNALLREARANVESSEARQKAARSGFLPEIAASLDYTRNQTDRNGIVSDGYSTSLSASQSIFSGFSTRAAYDQARYAAERARAELQSTKAEVSFELKSAFEGLVFAQEYAKLTQEILKRRQENLRLVELRFESGRENKGSVLLSKAYASQARYDALQAKNDRRTARARLARAIGVDEFSEFAVAGSVPVSSVPSERPDLRALALETPEYLQAVAGARSADAGVTAARSGFYPVLSARGSVGREGSDFFPDQDNRWSLGVSLTIPIFSGGSDYYGTKSAVQERVAAESRRIDTSRDRLADLEERYAAFEEAIEKNQVDASFKEAAEVRAEIGRKRYNNGLLTFDDWDVIENDLIARQKTYLQSRRDRVTAEASWEQAQGKGAIP